MNKKDMKNVDKILNNLLSGFKPKQKKVIEERFGLSGKTRTLQAIGDDLGVTRERIRQIEAQSIKKLESDIKSEFSGLLKIAEEILGEYEGVRRDDKFIEDVKEKTGINNADYINEKIRFIFHIASKPLYHKENDNFHAFWYKNKNDKKNLFDYVKKVYKFFKKNDKDEILENQIYKNEFDEPYFRNHVSISKKFTENVFGDFGLKEWPEIEPKVIRDKAYLVLKKKSEPLHFSDIAKEIGKMGIDNEKAHTQTVHNELIKDDRFVLVGRGIYGLKEHGYEGGTVKEVIEKLLKENGPMTSDKVVELVNQKKILKENTILLNLQNRNHFKRLDDGRYHVQEA